MANSNSTAERSESARPTSRANSTAVVYVACKLPGGITLELFEDAPPPPTLAQAQGLAFALKPPRTKAKVTLRGANSVKNDFTLRGLSQVVYPFGVTQVDASFWNEWTAKNGDFAFIKNGLVFALEKEREVLVEARQRETERTGLEPLKPECERDPRFLAQRGLTPETKVHHDPEWLAHLNRANGK